MDNDSSFLDATGPQGIGTLLGKVTTGQQQQYDARRFGPINPPSPELMKALAELKTPASKFEGGATRSHHAPEYEHLSKAAIERIISRMAYGATIHGPHNWRGGGQEFVNQCARHLMEHTLNLFAGDTTDDHLAAIGANFQMLAHFEAEGLKPTIFPSPRKANDKI